MTVEQEWRKAIAEQVRRHCTPSREAYDKGGDALIRAVADWLENPPEWAPFESPTVLTLERPIDLNFTPENESEPEVDHLLRVLSYSGKIEDLKVSDLLQAARELEQLTKKEVG